MRFSWTAELIVIVVKMEFRSVTRCSMVQGRDVNVTYSYGQAFPSLAVAESARSGMNVVTPTNPKH